MRIPLLLALVAAAMAPRASGAQAAVPLIATSAQGEVRVIPDRVKIWLSVQSRGSSAARAAHENANKQTAVISALHALSVPDSQISTEDYNVVPETRYDSDTKAPRIASYLVTNTLTVELMDVAIIGEVIDATLASGTNEIESIVFFASRSDQLYQQALSAAVANAQTEAAIMAQAAGGRLGPLIELTNSGGWTNQSSKPLVAMALSASTQTPILPGHQVIAASVSGKWVFLPSQ